MPTINLKIDGKKKAFKKNEFNLKDNLIAMKHQIKANNYYADKENEKDPEQYGKLQKDFLEMIVELFDNEFELEDLFKMPIEDSAPLNDCFTLALGGKLEADDEKKE